ncbi:MAG: PAS domain-containing protein [Oscillospiraceae bacterium]|nr:PAS domain-containing protein [Oscillospiraceae bacterium]
MEFYKTLAQSVAGYLSGENGGLYMIIACAAVTLLIILLVVTLAQSASKRKAHKRAQDREAELSAMYDVLPDMVVCKDNSDRFIHCNEAFEEFAGVKQAQLVGRNLSEMLDIAHRFHAEIAAADRKSISEGVKLTVKEHLTFPDGSKRYFETIRAPLIHRKGGTLGILCVFRDMTATHNVINQSIQIAETLEQKDKELEVVAAAAENLEKKDKELEQELKLTREELLKAKKAALCVNALKYMAAMGAALSEDDLSLYASYLFAIKMDTAVIGETELSEAAAQLEDAVHHEDRNYIKEHHPSFISSLSALLAKLDAANRAAENGDQS